MRLLSVLMCLIVAGCANIPFATVAPSSDAMAHLAIRDRVNYPVVPGIDGFVSVGSRSIPGGPARELWVEPGKRVIGYSCPGWITVDGPATISYNFLAGARYDLTCESPPTFELVR